MSTAVDPTRAGPIGQRSSVYSAAPTSVVDAISDPQSAVSWGAIFAGAAAAAALSLILLLLGTGLGLSSVSPWSFEGVSAETFGWSAIAWISFTSIAASGLGGYLAGRLRTKWLSVDRDESFFRDTAHGFLSWAVATLLTAALLTSAIGSILGAGAKAGASVAGAAGGAVATMAGGAAAAGGGAMAANGGGETIDYWTDRLFRRDASATVSRASAPPDDSAQQDGMSEESAGETAASPRPDVSTTTADATRVDGTVRAEIARIFVNGMASDALDADDSRYVAERIAEHTGLSVSEAEARVTDIQARMRASLEEAETTAREVAEEAREASAYAAHWLFITLLAGAFFAALFATFGGRQRDA